jgi:tetratricopeptide (TPR) repeat protein
MRDEPYSDNRSFLTDKPVLAVGVPDRPQPFLGRENFLAEVAARLCTGGTPAAAVFGPGGIGKTALAAALAHHPELQRRFGAGMLWAGLGLQGDALGVLADWGNALGKDVSGIPGLADRFQAVKRLIGERRILLVIDDVWDLDAARALQCGGPGCAHLITTRAGEIARAFAGVSGAWELSPLPPEAGVQLLEELAPGACREDFSAAETLAAACHGLPLALELLGGYLAAPERSLLPRTSRPAHRLRQAGEKLAPRVERPAGPPANGDGALADILRLCLETLPRAARAAFSDLGAFAPDPERFSWEAAAAVTLARQEILDLLAARRLLHSDRGQITLHQVLADVACADTSAEAAARHGRHYLERARSDRENSCQVAAFYGQVKWAWAAAPDEAILIEWIEALSQFQESCGQWRDYVDWAERGLRVASDLGLRHAQGVLYNNLAKIYSDLGQRDRALEYYQQALPILEADGDRGELAAALSNLGTVYASLGKPERARIHYQRALPMLEESGSHPALVTTLNNLGKLSGDLGEREQALFYYRRALPFLASLEDYDLESTTRFNLALLYRAQDRLVEAVAELRQVVALESLVGHPDLESDAALLAQVERELTEPRSVRWLRRLATRFFH